MRALTVVAGQAGSAQVREVAEPATPEGWLQVDGIAVGICGTDREIASGLYGTAPPGAERLILGHESLGRVVEAPADSGFAAGDLVVGVVRRPDPVPCGACARGEFDMCRNEGYTERGIKGIHGYASQRWAVEPQYAVKLPPGLAGVGMLVEPASVLAKAWDQIERIGSRSWFEPQRLLVTGAGPIGLLAALMGIQRGLEVHVLDRVTQGRKPTAVQELGAHYHHSPAAEVAAALRPDVIIEATGAPSLIFEAMGGTAPYGIVCLTGVSPKGRAISADLAAVGNSMVLENDVVFGSVNAGLRHYAAAVESLAEADSAWLASLITRRLPLERAAEAFTPHDDDIKIVVDLGE